MSEDLILITGASSDIGMALMRLLLGNSGRRILAQGFRGLDRLTELAAEFPERVIPLQADLSDPASTTALVKAVEEWGVPCAMIHLPARKLVYERFTKLNWQSFHEDMTIQVESAMVLLQKILPKMAKLPRSRVVFVLSSVVHGLPPKYTIPYTVVKYAQLGLMRALAAEYAATSVRINAVSPSMVETQFLSEVSDIIIGGAAASNPLGRNAVPGDVVGAIDFLLSPASDYITGLSLPIAAGTAI